MSEEELPLLKEFKTFLQSTLVAFGSDGASFSLVNQRFSEDWVGSPSLKEYAVKLGFKSVMKLLESIPDQVTILLSPAGEITLKPVPMEETRDNLATIDATNKELKSERMRRHQYGPLPASVIAQLASDLMLPPFLPPPTMKINPNLIPLGSSVGPPPPPPTMKFNPNLIPLGSYVGPPPPPPTMKFNPNLIPLGSYVGPPPPPLTKKFNPNLIPLGQLRFPRCASTSNLSGNTDGSGPSTSPMVSLPPRQPQRVMTFFGHRKPQPTAVVSNDFGDVVPTSLPIQNQQPNSTIPQFSAVFVTQSEAELMPHKQPNSTIPQLSAVSVTQSEAELMPHKQPNSTIPQSPAVSVKQPKMELIVRNDSYYEDDFRASASPRNGSPEPRLVKEPPKVLVQNGDRPTISDVKVEIGAKVMTDIDGDDGFGEFSDEDELDIDGILADDDWREEEDDDKECDTFLCQFNRDYCKLVPAGVYRLVHVFRQNGGSFNRVDLLEKKYFDIYELRLNSTERNSLLGAPATTRIVKDSFSKAAYPGLFRITERMSNCYGVSLLHCLTGCFVDSSFFLSNKPPVRSSSINTPIKPIPNDNVQQTNFGGQKICTVLSAYADLLDSMEEPPLSPPFNVDQLVLFRHDKLGMCRGKVVRQDNKHLAVKHLDSQSEHYVKMSAIYAFPTQLLNTHSTKSSPCSKMSCHPSTVVVPVNQQKFRCF